METLGTWRWFVAWLVVGAGFSFGLLSLDFILPMVVLVAIALACWQLLRTGRVFRRLYRHGLWPAALARIQDAQITGDRR
jgi:hypothetical protein